jgi:hypothetical protein
MKPPMWANQATPPPSAPPGARIEATPGRSCIRNQNGRNSQAGTRMVRKKMMKMTSVSIFAVGCRKR